MLRPPQHATGTPQPKGVLEQCARLCLVALGTFAPIRVLPTISGCNQALFASLRNSSKAEWSCGHQASREGGHQ